MAETKIDWADVVWNPVTGCSKVSEGCRNCYAERLWPRLRAMGNPVYKDRNFKDVACHPERLEQPMEWKKPRRIFVNSMSDLFHEDVPDEFIIKVFEKMANAQWINGHKFMVLTKCPERMKRILEVIKNDIEEQAKPEKLPNGMTRRKMTFSFPLQNIWLGVSVENQATADERVPLLLETPAAVRFISAEPLLGPVDLSPWLGISRYEEGAAWARDTGYDLDWVIVGGESGPGARPMHPDWARSLRDQCQAASVPFFFKQWGEWIPDGPGCGGPMSWQSNFMSPKHGPNPNWNPEFDGKPLHVYEGGKGEGSIRVGKKKAGRELDGRTWGEFPEVRR